MDEKTLQKLHALELEIAAEMKRICEKHRIRYFMIAGTLLGAVRHGGFIPWDEDMDFGMLRADFERFVSVCADELDREKYFLQTGDSDPGYTYAFAKIRLNGTRIVEDLSQEAAAHQGIFIDIFPFDNVPDSRLLRKLHERDRYLWKNMLAVKLGYHNGQNRAKSLQKLLGAAAAVLPADYIRKKKERAFTRYNGRTTKMVVTAEGSYRYYKEMIPQRRTQKLCRMPFAGTDFFTFAAYDAYLKEMYGDYMQLPPENQRNKHAVLAVDFGQYAEKDSVEKRQLFDIQ